MFQLNPLDLTNAWWQHLLMLIIPGVIGYIIGYRRGNGTIAGLQARLAQLDTEVEQCHQSVALLAVQKPAAATFDDLKVVEGIGPAIEKLLNESGIRTYVQLSNTSPETIREILGQGGPRFQVHDPESWPKQAEMAASGKWAELKEWQNVLSGGKA
ncbi:hypothetical protein [Dyadobacter sp. 676]|uniref:DUF4332 domain-containing protein n=1 Tax=Dyadobacter sp. 676 TaxID=3088362 RepID=A0AAU8FH10_9BACT